MKQLYKRLAAGALVAAAQQRMVAQYAPPPPPAPFQGFINEWLRQENPYLNQLDIGGAIRVRYENKDKIVVPGNPGSLDFRDHGADVDNAYVLERLRYHIGYADKWWSD